MAHITEGTVSELRDMIVPGVRIARRYWGDDSFGLIHTFHTADTVSFDGEGWVTITSTYYTERTGRRPQKQTDCWGEADTVAIIAMKPLGTSGAMTYAHNDSRLILPYGYADALAGGNWRLWDAFKTDGTRILRNVSLTDARLFLGALAPATS